MKEFGGPDAPEASQGQTRDAPGTPGTFGPDLCLNQCYRDRMSPGQTGHITGQMGRVPGTDGTHTRGCPAKILYPLTRNYYENNSLSIIFRNF